jgi:hypothetical protein
MPLNQNMEIVEPGVWGFILGGVGRKETNLWPDYKDLLRMEYGRDAFRTIRTEENRREHETWIVLEVKEPMMLDRAVMGNPIYYGQDYASAEIVHPYNGGIWKQPDPDWISDASDAIERTKDLGEGLASWGSTIALSVLGVGLGLFLFSMAGKK